MFQPREIVYGFAKGLYKPHNKYIITIYQDADLCIVACFTTSKSRAGISDNEIHHGAIYKDKKCISYVFEKGKTIGVDPRTNSDFSFAKRTVVTFDYGIMEGNKESFMKEFDNPEVVCRLYEKEYIDLVYAMYCSPHTKIKHKATLDNILREYYTTERDR